MDRALDTTPESDDAQIDAYRRMGGSGRAAVVFRLNDLAREAAMAGIRARHPDYDETRLFKASRPRPRRRASD